MMLNIGPNEHEEGIDLKPEHVHNFCIAYTEGGGVKHKMQRRNCSSLLACCEPIGVNISFEVRISRAYLCYISTTFQLVSKGCEVAIHCEPL